MPKPTLEALAKAGKAAREASERSRQEAAERVIETLDSEARRSTSPLGRFAGTGALFVLMSFGIPTLIMVVIGLVIPVSRHGSFEHENPAVWIGYVCLAINGAFVALIVVARLHVPVAVRAEDAWIKALPFALVGHSKLLGNNRCEFTIEFAAAGPERELFVLALDGASTATELLKAGGRDDPPYSVELECPTIGSARARWRTSRRLVATLLVPLHDKFPITAVRFR